MILTVLNALRDLNLSNYDLQTRPTSKTKRFTVLKIDRAAPSEDGKKVFTGM